MTAAELIDILYDRIVEVDQKVAVRMLERPINAEDYRALWNAITAELSLMQNRY